MGEPHINIHPIWLSKLWLRAATIDSIASKRTTLNFLVDKEVAIFYPANPLGA